MYFSIIVIHVYSNRLLLLPCSTPAPRRLRKSSSTKTTTKTDTKNNSNSNKDTTTNNNNNSNHNTNNDNHNHNNNNHDNNNPVLGQLIILAVLWHRDACGTRGQSFNRHRLNGYLAYWVPSPPG